MQIINIIMKWVVTSRFMRREAVSEEIDSNKVSIGSKLGDLLHNLIKAGRIIQPPMNKNDRRCGRLWVAYLLCGKRPARKGV